MNLGGNKMEFKIPLTSDEIIFTDKKTGKTVSKKKVLKEIGKGEIYLHVDMDTFDLLKMLNDGEE